MNPINLTQTVFAPLGAHLLDLVAVLEGEDIPLILVGGFGLYLRQEVTLASEQPRLYADAPEPRATEDFDIVLKLSLLADVAKMQRLRAALHTLGYAVVESAREYQFVKPDTAWGGHRNVKVDLLAREPEDGDPRLHLGGVRIMPKKRNNPLHARRTPEAIAVEEGLTPVTLEGKRTDGGVYQGTVFLPAPYALYLMKLFAFRDEQDGTKGAGRERYARKHALDLYTLTANLTPDEFASLSDFQIRYEQHPIVEEAGRIVHAYFRDEVAAGTVRLLEASHALANLTDFLALLTELFPFTQPT